MREARLNRQLTQQELSDQCGFTKSMLSKIENGHISVAIATLSKIAENLGLPISWFLDEKEEHNLVIVPFDKRVSTGSSNEIGYTYELLANATRFGQIEPTVVTIDPDLERTEPFTHTEDEFIYILEGKIRLFYDGETYSLQKDDSAYFIGEKPHIFLPASDEQAKVLTIFIRTKV